MPKMLIPALLFAATLGLAGCNNAPGADAGGAEAKAATSKDWSQTVVGTPEGGFRIGNPDAKVKLVEYASYTCTHCKDFHIQGATPLKQGYVKGGQVSYEYRPFMLNIYDFAAVLLATCETPEKTAVWTDELYNNHDAWVLPFTKLGEADITPLRSLPPEQQLKGLAEAGGMDDFARARGMTKARFDQCMTDKARLDRKTAAQTAAQDKYQISGTPTFLINGKKAEGTTWAVLEPQLKAAVG